MANEVDLRSGMKWPEHPIKERASVWPWRFG